LGNHIEHVTLTGTANIDVIGNNLSNNLKGNSGNNILNGGVGADIMTGGVGDDTYYIDSVSDTVIELDRTRQ
jgi:Ca2+-binding RTX toxin-like protein